MTHEWHTSHEIRIRNSTLFVVDLPQHACLHVGLHGLLYGEEASHGQGGGEDAQGTEG